VPHRVHGAVDRVQPASAHSRSDATARESTLAPRIDRKDSELVRGPARNACFWSRLEFLRSGGTKHRVGVLVDGGSGDGALGAMTEQDAHVASV
jgi:hypothetical protein